MYVTWNGYTGYMQYDRELMNTWGSGGESLYVHLDSSAARIRTSPVNGSILVTIPANSTARVISINENKSSDGYRWMQVIYGSTNGWMQYDPKVMHFYG